MSHYPIYEADPLWIKGWGVFNPSEWHFHGLYPSRAQADIQRAGLGPNYIVKYGTRRMASDDFVFADSDDEIASQSPFPTRWEKNSQYIELEGVLGDRGQVLIVGTNIPWDQLPVEMKEQILLSGEQECSSLYKTVAIWAEQNLFKPKSVA